ncbi:MAG: hypothetical protein ABIS86_02730 [Streptosporangiaceae bacterium]
MTEPSPLQRVGLSSGYLLTGLLVLAAAAILAWPLLDSGPARTPGAVPVGVTPGPAEQPAPQESASADPAPGGGGGGGGGGVNGAGPCGTQSVSWQKAGTGITVTVVYLGVGNVTATIVPTQGDQQEKHYSTAMDATPHVFSFALPDTSVKRVSLSVVTQADGVMKSCDVGRS